MQNRYTGDIGDFGKYALLKALAGNDLRLGVHWYLNEDEKGNKRDGGLTKYWDLRECDPPLYDKLQAIVKPRERLERKVSRVEQDEVLPQRTIFYSDPLGFRDLPFWNRAGRASLREEWNRRALDAMAEADIVFMDPDNGIVASQPTQARSAGRSTFSPTRWSPMFDAVRA